MRNQKQTPPTSKRSLAIGKLVFVMVAATVIFEAFCGAIRSTAGPGDRLYEFFFCRSAVQLATMYVCALAITLLLFRAIRHLGHRVRLSWAESRNGSARLPKALVKHLNAVRNQLTRNGAAAAVSRAENIAQEHEAAVRRAYEPIGFLGGLLPALGLFGTVLGLSNSLFAAFAGGTVGPEAVQQFVTALATALDTTVLAMACAIPVFAAIWLLSRLEAGLGDRYAALVCKAFQTEKLNAALAGAAASTSPPAASPESVDVFRAELRAVTAEIASQTQVAFAELLRSAAKSHEQHVDRSLQRVLDHQRNREETTGDKIAVRVADRLGKSVDSMYKLIEKHNGRATKHMLREFRRLETALRERTPEEVILRFNHNGKSAENDHEQEQSHAGA